MAAHQRLGQPDHRNRPAPLDGGSRAQERKATTVTETKAPVAQRPKRSAAERVRIMTNMAELYKQGYSIREIAKWAGISYTTAHYWLSKARVPFRDKSQPNPKRGHKL